MVFTKHPDGTYEPSRKVKINKKTSGPGEFFSNEHLFGSINIVDLVGCEIEAVEEGNTLVIKEFS
ncbi:hypothetical protein ACFLY1_01065 [Patescibacteria group bacterium]